MPGPITIALVCSTEKGLPSTSPTLMMLPIVKMIPTIATITTRMIAPALLSLCVISIVYVRVKGLRNFFFGMKRIRIILCVYVSFLGGSGIRHTFSGC